MLIFGFEFNDPCWAHPPHCCPSWIPWRPACRRCCPDWRTAAQSSHPSPSDVQNWKKNKKMFISKYESKIIENKKYYKILHLVSCWDVRETYAVLPLNHSGRQIGNHQLRECVIYFMLRFSEFPNLCLHFPSVV